MGAAGSSQTVDQGRVDTYDGVTKLLHWIIAALVFVQYATKMMPVDAFGVFTDDLLDAWHVSIGPTILALMVVRLAWRLTHRVPSPQGNLPPALRLVWRSMNWLFYAILLLLPMLGWLAASGYHITPYILGFIPLPALVAPNERLGGRVGQIHGVLAWALLAIIALHIAAALYHALIEKNGMLGRMFPGSGKNEFGKQK